jgi:hypothetical protein
MVQVDALHPGYAGDELTPWHHCACTWPLIDLIIIAFMAALSKALASRLTHQASLVPSVINTLLLLLLLLLQDMMAALSKALATRLTHLATLVPAAAGDGSSPSDEEAAAAEAAVKAALQAELYGLVQVPFGVPLLHEIG